MKIIVAGAGKVGWSITEILASEGHDITVIDNRPETITALSNSLDVICVEGNAADPECLREAGAAHADLLLAATEKDEVNMVCGVSAHHMGTGHVIARIREPQYLHQTAFLRDALGLSVIVNPEYECAREISRILRFPGASHVTSFSKGSVELVEHRVPEKGALNGIALKDLPGLFKAKVLISLVERGGTALIPNGSTVLQAGDRLSITGKSSELRRFFVAIGEYRKPVKQVMIMGGGRITVYLSRLLQENGINVTVVEKKPEYCDRLCDRIPDAQIVCGDGTDRSLLEEYGINSADAFVSLTGDDGDNIITSLYAHDCRVGKIVTKVNREHFAEILNSTGLDSIVSPKEVVTHQIARYVRAMSNSAGSSMELLYRLADGKVEALEFKVLRDSACAGKPLRELPLRKNVLIAALIRGSKSILPDGETIIQPGDHAVVVSLAGKLKSLDDILEEER